MTPDEFNRIKSMLDRSNSADADLSKLAALQEAIRLMKDASFKVKTFDDGGDALSFCDDLNGLLSDYWKGATQ